MAQPEEPLPSTLIDPVAQVFHAGDVLGKYAIKRQIGRGGSGIVFQATDVTLKRPVALKVLAPAQADDRRALRRFVREAHASARLQHDNVVAIYEIDKQSDYVFIVMELARGGSAKDLVARRGGLPWKAATRVIADACRGLAAAHAVALVHRDIKPSNLLITRSGTTKVADFGLAKFRAGMASSLTDAFRLLGTPLYMSPEQCRGEAVDDRSDLYSLGATYFAMLTGRAPFAHQDPMMVLYAHCATPAPDPRTINAHLPAACCRIVATAMAKEPAKRFPSAAAMLAALEALLPHRKGLPDSSIPIG